MKDICKISIQENLNIADFQVSVGYSVFNQLLHKISIIHMIFKFNLWEDLKLYHSKLVLRALNDVTRIHFHLGTCQFECIFGLRNARGGEKVRKKEQRQRERREKIQKTNN